MDDANIGALVADDEAREVTDHAAGHVAADHIADHMTGPRADHRARGVGAAKSGATAPPAGEALAAPTWSEPNAQPASDAAPAADAKPASDDIPRDANGSASETWFPPPP